VKKNLKPCAYKKWEPSEAGENRSPGDSVKKKIKKKKQKKKKRKKIKENKKKRKKGRNKKKEIRKKLKLKDRNQPGLRRFELKSCK